MVDPATTAAAGLTMDLIRFPSISTTSNRDITEFLSDYLRERGWQLERLSYWRDGCEKHNVVARRGTGEGGLAYFGHTDVVPADEWTGPSPGPFDPVTEANRLYGRGSCDMKGSIACFLTATERFHGRCLPMYVVLTSDEETGQYGAAHVVAESILFRELRERQCATLIGEPTGLSIVYAHKGTCLFRAIARGRAAHSAGTEGNNANLAMIPFLSELLAMVREMESDPCWRDVRFDPPTLTANIGINDGNPAVNITSPRSVCTVFLRPMPGQDITPLLERMSVAAAEHGLETEITRHEPAFLIDPTSPFVRQLLKLSGTTAARTINFGTDASQLGQLRRAAIVGPGSISQAHTSDEFIELDQITKGIDFYSRCIRAWCECDD